MRWQPLYRRTAGTGIQQHDCSHGTWRSACKQYHAHQPNCDRIRLFFERIAVVGDEPGYQRHRAQLYCQYLQAGQGDGGFDPRQRTADVWRGISILIFLLRGRYLPEDIRLHGQGRQDTPQKGVRLVHGRARGGDPGRSADGLRAQCPIRFPVGHAGCAHDSFEFGSTVDRLYRR